MPTRTVSGARPERSSSSAIPEAATFPTVSADAGLDVDDDGHCALGAVGVDDVEHGAFSFVLQRLVEGQDEVLTPGRRPASALTVGNVAASGIALELDRSGRAPETVLVGILETGQAVAVGTDEADHRL